jgi:hypothetical protein
MSKGIRRKHLKSPFEAKRVIVAACAAVAMVLGAMSVGASVSPTADHSTAKAAISSISDTRSDNSTSSSVASTNLSRQHTLEVRNFLQQQNSPLYTSAPSVTKTLRNSLSPIFGTANPVLLMDQMVQMQQTSSTSTTGTSTGKDADAPISEGTTTPSDNSTSSPTTDEDPTLPSDDKKSSGDSATPPSATVLNMDGQSTPPPAQ